MCDECTDAAPSTSGSRSVVTARSDKGPPAPPGPAYARILMKRPAHVPVPTAKVGFVGPRSLDSRFVAF